MTADNHAKAQGFTVALCRQVESWQDEWSTLEQQKERLDDVMEHAYGLLDALGISSTALPGTRRMKFWLDRKVIYGSTHPSGPSAARETRAPASEGRIQRRHPTAAVHSDNEVSPHG